MHLCERVDIVSFLATFLVFVCAGLCSFCFGELAMYGDGEKMLFCISRTLVI